MREAVQDVMEFLLGTIGGILLLCALVALVFLALFWPAGEEEPLPWLGLVGRNIDGRAVQKYRLPFDRGVVVEKVFSNSPADFSNLAPGDCIVKFNNRVVLGEEMMQLENKSDAFISDRGKLCICLACKVDPVNDDAAGGWAVEGPDKI